MSVLIPVSELADAVSAGGALHLLDVRWALGGPPGRAEFEAGHVPGAVYVDLDTELSAPAGEGVGRHPLPAPEALQEAARSWGLRSGVPVVVYDGGSGAAARAWWLLRWAGHPDVRLLDGGLPAWRAAGLPLETGRAPAPEPGDVTLGEGRLPTLDADGAARLVAEGGLLLDARAAERYRGEVASVDPKPGHIPGAVSAPYLDNLAADGRFLPPAELAARFTGLGVEPGRPVGVYCGSGVTAASQIVALAVAGHEDVALYPGSWSQWATLPGRPVATGAEAG
ncbi:sulfurtransferase [Motilibacter aurantiacus]|uniref:sulfurtransferase n=1 Tax=Motilibacter aurantiacus TaxID=2714955 RepID=UPI00140E5BA3|nr:sulfurtransferase [Motilibacter aurantiacus]NHC46023.1 sulfurtransferase [Motilibacter aurantiacus]